MEAWIGLRWHQFVTRWADADVAEHAVTLDSVRRPVEVLFRAAGGPAALRVVPAAAARIGGPRRWLQRLAGSGTHAAVPRLDGQTLALPPVVAVFASRQLNHDLYLWLAAMAAAHRGGDWLTANVAATAAALAQFPGLRTRWQALRDAHLAMRPDPATLDPAAASAEAAVQRALRQDPAAHAMGPNLAGSPGTWPGTLAPVWLWLDVEPAQTARGGGDEGQGRAQAPSGGVSAQDARRRRTRERTPRTARAPLLLPSRAESILTFADPVPVDRAQDDGPDDNALAAADNQDALALQRDGATAAGRVRFDLDLPSACADDRPLGPGESLPEWDWKQQRLRPDHCRALTLVAAPGEPFRPDAALRATARRVRRNLEALRAAPGWQRGCADGDALDLDAWVRHRAGLNLAARERARPPEPRVYARRDRRERSLATLLLADLSLSTDAHVNDTQRVVDVIRDALFVMGEALQGGGDAFAMFGFSSVRRAHVRLQHLKGFDEAWGDTVRHRVGAIKPGYYTRMGAAVRLASRRLGARSERQRLLLLLTDGKPNDLDVYEGRWGLEDTRHAVLEARAAGLTPFCLSIDDQAQDYLPHLFGPRGWAQLRRPAELPVRLAQLHATLTRA
jgi:nitric oxide reductase NorD protein